MPCYYPLHGYKARRVSPSGKRAVVFNVRDGYSDLPVAVPCGQCIGCRLERSRQWAIRCMHEASLYEDNCFITLTYSDEHLPPFGGLDRKAFPLFMKRLRKAYAPKRVRFYHCGEYGSRTGRPHYHAILFNHDFRDKVAYTVRNGFPVWRSGELEKLWQFGLSEIGSVTFESAAYVARYILKKVTGDEVAKESAYSRLDEATGEVARVDSEYTTMSRGGRGHGAGGIGKPWLEKFGCEVYPADGVVVRGRLVKPPRFYDMQYELVAPEEVAAARAVRQRKRDRKEETDERREVAKAITEARLNLHSRRIGV